MTSTTIWKRFAASRPQRKPSEAVLKPDDRRSRHLTLNYLILIGHVEVLPSLYNSVLIPPAVREEMLCEDAPASVRKWISEPPLWLKVQAPPTSTAPQLSRLGAGENEAIRVALDLRPLFLLMDEVRGRKVAKGLSLPVVGTLGILKAASRRGLIDLQTA